jgi:hypothetical protein
VTDRPEPPKTADVLILLGTIAMMGAPIAFPRLNQLAGILLFWGGLVGIAFFVVWRWGWHYVSPLLSINSRLPLQDAARVVYEAMERAGVVDLTTSASSPPEVRLNHYKYVLLSDDQTILYGKRPPSENALPIRKIDLKEYYPIVGENQINYIRPFDRVAYTDVTVRRRDVRRVIREYPGRAREFAEQFGISD